MRATVGAASCRPRRGVIVAVLGALLAGVLLAVAALAAAGPAGAASTYWVDVCASGNEAGVLTSVAAGGASNAKMSTNCGSGSADTLAVTVTNGGQTTATTGSSTTATTTITYKVTAEAGEQANWVVDAPSGETISGSSDSNATYNDLTHQKAEGPGVAWGLGFAELVSGSWSAGPAGAAFADCIGAGTTCGKAGVATSAGSLTETVPGVTAFSWGASCSWAPSATSNCNDDGSTATLVNWKLQISDPNTGAAITPVASQSLNGEEGHWVTAAEVDGTTAEWNMSDPGGVCSDSAYLSAEWAQDGTLVGQQMDAASQNSEAFDSGDGDFDQATCTGPASMSFSPSATSLPTGAYDVDAAAANPAQSAADKQTVSTDGTLYVDNNVPTVSLTGPTPGIWSAGPTTVSVDASDGSEAQGQNSGVESTTCADADNATWANGNPGAHNGYNASQSEQVTLSAAGTDTLFCTATNGVGTVSETQSLTAKIDPQRPVLAVSKVAPAPKLLRTPPTFTATGSEKLRLSGVSTSCSAHNLSTGDRLMTKPRTGAARLTLTSGGRWTVTCTARTGAGLATSHNETVDLAPQPLKISLKLGYRLKHTFTYIKTVKYIQPPAGTLWNVVLRTPRGRRVRRSARTRAAVTALVRWIETTPYESGDRLTITLSRKGYRTLTGVISIHLHRDPSLSG